MPHAEDHHTEQLPFTGNTVVEIDVPSGRLIAADDLRSVKYFDIEPPLSLGGVGLDAWARIFAQQANTAYAFVGNSSPLITQQSDGSIEVVSPDWGDGPDAPELLNGEVVVARVFTDVWATRLTDHQNWVDHGGIAIETLQGGLFGTRFTAFAVPAGKYRWTVFSHADGFEMHAAGRVTFARLECIQKY